MYTYFYEFDIGKIAISENAGKITNLYFLSDQLPEDKQIYETPVLKEAAKQLKSYLAARQPTKK